MHVFLPQARVHVLQEVQLRACLRPEQIFLLFRESACVLAAQAHILFDTERAHVCSHMAVTEVTCVFGCLTT